MKEETKDRIAYCVTISGALIVGVCALIIVFNGLNMANPLHGDLDRAERDLRLCQITEGCDMTKAEARLEKLEEEISSLRQYYASIIFKATFPGLVGLGLVTVGFRNMST